MGKTTCATLVACGLLAALAAGEGAAQAFPSKPVRLVVGFSPGGSADVTARLVAQRLTQLLGQTVLVENRGGASGAIANERVATSPPDGYTALLVGGSATVLPMLRGKLPYDLERDLAPVSLLAISPFALAMHPSVPVRDARDLLRLARSRPGNLNFGSVGTGSTPHLMGELFKVMGGVDMLHVPYKGGAENVAAVAAGHVDMCFASIPSLLPLLTPARVRPIAVTTLGRAAAMPQLPTLHESGLPGYDRSSWQGVMVPVGVPREIIARLSAAIGQAVNSPELKESFAKQGLEPRPTTPEQFAAHIRGEIEKNAKLLTVVGAKPQ